MHEENPFKIRAFTNAADVVQKLDEAELISKVKSGALTDLKGIGKGTLLLAKQLLETGNSDELEKAVQGFPMTIIELRPIKGLGPKRIAQLWRELGIKTLGELEYACTENRLVNIKSLGSKIQTRVLEQIQEIKSRRGKMLLCDALDACRPLLEFCRKNQIPVYEAGDLGRRLPIVEEIQLILAAETVARGLDVIEALPVKDIEANKKSSLVRTRLKTGPLVEITIVPPLHVGQRLVRSTSSDAHFVSLESQAQRNKLKLDDVEAKTDREFYQALGVAYHPSEAREFDIADSRHHQFVELTDLTGVFHLHTVESDGLHTLEEMSDAAQKFGWSFMGLSDHSQTAAYARGLTDQGLEAQKNQIKTLRKSQKDFEILRGVESDILKDGSLDYSTPTLESLDFVIASIHSRYGMTEMTDRLLKAIENPYTSMIGHISGRLLLAREPYGYDVDKIITAAIKHKRVIELNANPHRLDMDWRFLADGAKRGLLISINPDAHSMAALGDVRFGVWMANKALFPKEQIINTWPLEKIKRLLQNQRA